MAFEISGKFVEPSVVATHFLLREGDSVADFGSGTGHFLKSLSTAVGASGSVYAFEIQKGLLEKLETRAREEHLSNIHPIWCDLEVVGGTKLADGILDAGILVNTLFQLEKKDLALKEIARLLRKGGKFFVIDWSESFAGMGPQPEYVVTESDARTMIEQAGFTFERSYPAGGHHYGLAFRKI